MFKSLVAAASVAVCLTGNAFVTEAASAYTGCRTLSSGWEICTLDNGDYGSDRINVYKPNGELATKMTVICTGNGGNRWSASTDQPKADNQKLANWWCAKY